MDKIKLKIITWLMGKDDFLLFVFQNRSHLGSGVLCCDDENDNLQKTALATMDNRAPIAEFVLGITSKYLKNHPDIRTKFSKEIYNNE